MVVLGNQPEVNIFTNTKHLQIKALKIFTLQREKSSTINKTI